MRALVVTNMYPTAERPPLGSFVRDQVEALRRRGDVEVELFAFGPGPSS
jgi:teichuronic acid biosynthesis glycosyltransferase TuaC